ncbi:protein NUCLEAR FUSION DEFECTIVE 4-like [Aegilops tauschii subsp. strangulata]|uniref:protein NUCLEAR FUSION DEFECTIVE 4-like n=1 Tax=Aegilops tauschii subsp. strangulata TaxID=200361 RepID=UPI00098A792B|nr:protein NUCLEAR FUSION DEFECTIVE 4-like [Aegilops tauschii subsp. strangulata]
MAAAARAFAAHVLRGRWFMAHGSFLIMSAAGATYIFAVYSKDIKATLGYTQEQLNTVGFFKDVGANVGIHAGLIAEVAPPWLVLSIGAAMNLGGYLMLYLSVAGVVRARPPLWLVCLYIAVGANSQAFANTGALVTCVKNFPESRGVILGLLKGFVGLSGAIFTQLYLAFYGGGGGDTRPLILLVGWLPAAVSVAFLGTIRIIRSPRSPAAARREYRAFCGFLYVSLALAAYLMVVIILQKRFLFTRAEFGVSAAVVLAMLLVPFTVVLREEAALFKNTREAQTVVTVATKPRTPAQEPAAVAEKPAATLTSRVVRALRPPPLGDDYTILQALVSVDMLLLFTATVFGMGGTLTAIDNMGQIGESLGYPQRSIATFVSLISIWNYLGRVASGFASEALLARYRLPRPLVLAVVLLLTVPGHLLISFGVPGSLYVASVIIGFCFGAAQPLILASVSELFGLRYYSTLYNLCGTASPVGSYVLNVRVAGRMYDREAARQGGGHAVASAAGKRFVTCIGVRCYKESFLVITAVTVAAAAVTLVLAWRTRGFYAGDVYARFKEEEEEETVVVGQSRNGVAASETTG